jgi:hypothetical protein
MTSLTTARPVLAAVLLASLIWASPARAQFLIGSTWVRTDDAGKGVTLTIGACCNGGYRLTYQFPAMGGQPATVLTIDSPLNGTEVPALANGKPSGQTMALKRVDDRHYTAAVKMNGQPLVTSNGTVSADGKAMTVETFPPSSPSTKIIETWVRK